MALRKLIRSNHGEKLQVSIRYENLYSFKKGVILLCQSILETRRISHLHGSPLFTISLRISEYKKYCIPIENCKTASVVRLNQLYAKKKEIETQTFISAFC